MILSGTSGSAEVPVRLRAFGVDPSGTLAVLTTALADEGRIQTRLTEALERYFAAHGIAVVLATGTQDTVAIFGWKEGKDELVAFAADLATAVEDVRRITAPWSGWVSWLMTPRSCANP